MEASKNISYEISINDESIQYSLSIQSALNQAMMEIDDFEETIISIKGLKVDCDKLDYILGASSGVLCAMIDVVFVGNPKESIGLKNVDKWTSKCVKNFAKYCHPDHRNFDDLASALRFLETTFKIPYDQVGLNGAGREVFNLNPKNHHFKSLPHNLSLLGLIFSVIDQFNNTSHFVSNGDLISLEKAGQGWELKGNNFVAKVFSGVVNWFGHIVSDISGSSSSADSDARGMGIPSPLWTWINDLISIKRMAGFETSEMDKAMQELAINIFKNGYDARFQLAQAIPVLINELIVRFIYAVRRFYAYFIETENNKRSFTSLWDRCEPFSNPAIRRVLTVAHGTFCLIDLTDAFLKSEKGDDFEIDQFVLYLNVVGIGCFAVSLFDEMVFFIKSKKQTKKANDKFKNLGIAKDYVEGLKQLANRYDDKYLLSFLSDFQRNELYVEALSKSEKLAQMRNVPENRILRNKADIDNYFKGV